MGSQGQGGSCESVQKSSLRRLLMGDPLVQRAEGEVQSELAEELNGHLRALRVLVADVYSADFSKGFEAESLGIALATTLEEIDNVILLPPEEAGAVQCKRALLLVGLAWEPEVQRYFSDSYSQFVAHKVLRMLVPRVIRHSGQCPGPFVALTALLAEMWHGEEWAGGVQ